MRCYLGLGSNLPHPTTNLRESNLTDAITALQTNPSITCRKISPCYETEPMGVKDQPWFLNLVIEIETSLSAEDLLDVCLSIESAMGRLRNPEQKNGPRVIDIDILLYGTEVLNTERLSLPHPGLTTRSFVLKPLVDLAPDFQHPRTGQHLIDVLQNLVNPEAIRVYALSIKSNFDPALSV